MGTRGPIGKRSTAKAGHRTKAEKAETEVVEVGMGAAAVEMPPPSDLWDPVARDWYCSLAESGQARFMEPSDWQGARFVAEAMTQAMASERMPAMLFSYVWSAMNDLLTTEGARRRVKIEVERKGLGAEPSAPSVAILDDYRRSVQG